MQTNVLVQKFFCPSESGSIDPTECGSKQEKKPQDRILVNGKKDGTLSMRNKRSSSHAGVWMKYR
jgi:hypothetical protein